MTAPEVTEERTTSFPSESVVVTTMGTAAPLPNIGPAVGTGDVVTTIDPLELVVL